jgi:hypothetical protein
MVQLEALCAALEANSMMVIIERLILVRLPDC